MPEPRAADRATESPAGKAASEGDGGAPAGEGEPPGRPASDVPHAMDMPEGTRENLSRRLARVRGQVEGIRRMVNDGRYCADILQQFAAVHSALKSTEKELLANHLERCATRAIAEGGERAEEVREEILELFSRYME